MPWRIVHAKRARCAFGRAWQHQGDQLTTGSAPCSGRCLVNCAKRQPSASRRPPHSRRPAESMPDAVFPTLQASVENIALGLTELGEFPDRARGRAVVVEKSASTDAAYANLRGREGRMAVVTSPPYATALPYIDTDRLSVVLLGLASASSLRELERVLYGSREWTTSEARVWSERLEGSSHDLPQDVVDLCCLVVHGPHRNETASGGRRPLHSSTGTSRTCAIRLRL